MAELADILKDEYQILSTKPVSHLHLKAPMVGLGLTTSWTKLALDATNFTMKNEGGFTFDDANNRVDWDIANSHNLTINTTFHGDAGIDVTAGMSGTVAITLGLFVGGILKLETPITFTALDSTQAFGANGYPEFLQGEGYELYIKASVGTPTVTVKYFQTTIEAR